MVYIQVQHIHTLFAELGEIKANGWKVVHQPPPVLPKVFIASVVLARLIKGDNGQSASGAVCFQLISCTILDISGSFVSLPAERFTFSWKKTEAGFLVLQEWKVNKELYVEGRGQRGCETRFEGATGEDCRSRQGQG